MLLIEWCTSYIVIIVTFRLNMCGDGILRTTPALKISIRGHTGAHVGLTFNQGTASCMGH